MIPNNLVPALQASGYDITVQESFPYSQGVISVLMGDVQNDGNIITQDIQMAMANTGLAYDDLARYLMKLDDNIRAVTVADPSIAQNVQDFHRCLYFTFFIEYLKLFAMADRYVPPDDIYGIAQSKGVPPDLLNTFLNIQVFNKNMYALSVKNPPGIQGQISPWIYVYNDGGKTKLFLSKDEMDQFNKKFGKLDMIGTLKKNAHMTGIGILLSIAIVVVIGIVVKKKKDKIRKMEEDVLRQMESEAGGDIE